MIQYFNGITLAGMRISRIYYDGVLKESERVNLSTATSHYVMHVLRLKVGAKIILFNGNGKEYLASLVSVQRKMATVEVGNFQERYVESPLNIHLGQAICRNEKMDWILQKAVELGVHKITPLVTDFCNIKLSDDRQEKRLAHWRNVIVSACEQSGRTTLPFLAPIMHFADWVRSDLAPARFYCDPCARQTIATIAKVQEVSIAVGPEGGLSEYEVERAAINHFIGITLGPRILRTETAALAIVTALQARWGDLCLTL